MYSPSTTAPGTQRSARVLLVTDFNSKVPVITEHSRDQAILEGTNGLSPELRFLPMNPNFSDYRIPSMRDMPPLQHGFADSYEPTGPFGAKGLGELNMDPTAAVISNAIFDAVGVRIKTLPITPEKILRTLREKNKS